MRFDEDTDLGKQNHVNTILRLGSLFSVAILVIIWLGSNGTHPKAINPASSIQGESTITCLSAREISDAIEQFSSGEPSRVRSTRALLLDKSSRSTACRNEIVIALMREMDRPNLNFNSDNSSYYLWLYGAALLGELRAAEALDLLISHMNLTQGYFNSSMNHQPALKGLIKMGSIAIPKLTEVLRHNPDRAMRYFAVYCIATIGGNEAVNSLKESLNSESDDCVKLAIRVSLDSFDDEGQIKNRMDWFAGVMCKIY